MESDEFIDLVDSVNTSGSVGAKEERETPCEHFEKTIHATILFN